MSTLSSSSQRRGTILIVTMLICFTLASVVLVLCHSMSVEAVASANEAAGLQADAIERGAEQYVLGLMVANAPISSLMSETNFGDSYWDGVQLGKGYFWIMRPDYADDTLPAFGLVDECSKLDLNYASMDQLQLLPGMTQDLAAALEDWRNPNVNNPNGAKDDYYLSLPTPYNCKQSPYESVEETLMVRGMTKPILYGEPGASSSGANSSSSQFGTGMDLTQDGSLPHGLSNLLTVNAYGSASNGTTVRGRVNANTAPRAVLGSIQYIADTDADNIASYRQSVADLSAVDYSWVRQQAPSIANGNQANWLVVGSSLRYSADILAVNGNGRGFRRVKIIIDTAANQNATSTAPRMVYRRDFTQQGWPLDPAILDQIRAGTYQSAGTVYTDGLSGGAAH